MSHSSGSTAVYAAIVGNLIVTISKFIGFFMTSS